MTSLPDDLRALREAAFAAGMRCERKDGRSLDKMDEADAAESRILSTVAALTEERDALKAEVKRLKVCDCGRTLSTPLCQLCDNDE
jgi:hypothetical protein